MPRLDPALSDLDPLHQILGRTELRLACQGLVIQRDPSLGAGFVVAGPERIVLGAPVAHEADRLRHAAELAWLIGLLPDRPVLAGLAAARTAALFSRLERRDRQGQGSVPTVMTMAGDDVPPRALLNAAWHDLAAHQPDLGCDPSETDVLDAVAAQLTAIWPLLGPAEWIMETGGDARLRVDPATGLNAYGCSHRPRPWAISFASSTASSVSERGYAGAERGRRDLLAAALRGEAALEGAAAGIRQAIAAHYDLPAGCGVVLSASGTDCELVTLALAQMADRGQSVTSIVPAPEETGRGVPLSAIGRHFAADTSRGAAVAMGEPIAGFDPRTRLAAVVVRDADGLPRPDAAVAAACIAEVAAAPGRCLLHILDVSKTGLVAPGAAASLRIVEGGAVDVAVDACQARLGAARIGGYLRHGWMVMVTGSKFFTGPPFAGAVLMPPAMLARLRQAGSVPPGLADYAARAEWPDAPATACLPAGGNPGLVLRWHAALAEMQAFQAVDDEAKRSIVLRFMLAVRAALVRNPDLRELPGNRANHATSIDDSWDSVPTILCFTVCDPVDGRALSGDHTRAVYRWLNADLRAALPDAPTALAERRCHIGQPVVLPDALRRMVGVLRLSAGARLISGEPSLDHLDPQTRLDREIADAELVFAKLSLILHDLDRLRNADPPPSL